MAIVKAKPTSPGQRGLVKVVHKNLHKGKPYAGLVEAKKKSTGRNNQGRITSWQRGGGHKRRYRIIDWKRNKINIPGKVERLEYDPNRTALIALVLYADGERRYIIAPKGLKEGDKVISGQEAPIEVGNALPIRNIPEGSLIHCIELHPGKGAKLARSAGTVAQLMAKEGQYATIRLRSTEMRKVPINCVATIGEVSNSEHSLRKLGKAGAQRWRNKRPNVRGVAMNPVDHPLGGGEGRSSGGRPPCSPWGLPEGTKTRKNKTTQKYIVRKRKGKK